ncbi:MAG: hypothetical protein ACERKD_12610 [Prolixibacteraceae bacterium]
MNTDSEDKNSGNSFEYRLREVSDDEIISILRFREHFQKPAVKAAIKEALKRGIIQSLDDLNGENFQPQALAPRSLFPIGLSELQNVGIFKSLCRIFYGYGLLPIIYGVMQLTRHFSFGAIAAILTGIIVIYFSYQLEKTRKPFYSNLILGLNLPAMGFAIYYLTSTGNPSTMDAVAIGIVLLVMLYTTFYANKLASHFNTDISDD